MPAQLNSVLERLQKQAAEASLAQKVIAVLLAAVIAIGGFALYQFTSRPQMSPLFTNLSPADASAIVDELNSAGVQYSLTGGGGTIMVPNNQLYDTRLAVAAAGLPANSDAGYALLDNMSMTSSEFQQQVTYQRALEGELAKTIGAMDGVTAASVKLAIPQDSVFASETPNPTASVFIQTGPTGTLSPAAVQAIVNLVSASIEGMNPEDVAVIDSNGVVLSSVGGDSSTIMQAGQVSDYEQRIAANVQQMLDEVLGAGNAVVSVTAELDYDKTQTTTETFSSDPSVAPLSESTSREEYTGSGSTATGVLGPDNISVPGDATNGDGSYLKETDVVNNAVNKVTQIQETAPGSVQRQSVSVVVSDAVAGSMNMNDLQAMVAAAAGIDENRGDVVNVASMTFDTTAAETAQTALAEAVATEQAAATRTMYIDIAKWASLALIVIVVFVLILRMGRKAKEDERMTLSLEAIEELENRTQLALENRAQAVLDRATQAANGEVGLELEAAPVPEMDDVAEAVRNEIMTFAAQQPAEVAEVLRGWISTGRQR